MLWWLTPKHDRTRVVKTSHKQVAFHNVGIWNQPDLSGRVDHKFFASLPKNPTENKRGILVNNCNSNEFGTGKKSDVEIACIPKWDRIFNTNTHRMITVFQRETTSSY